jgi:hypothetical protein
MTSETIVWSCGGGTQSAAIAALIVSGELPKPAAAAIADTGREASETWRYYDQVIRPELSAVGVDLIRLPHSFDGTGWNTVDIWGGEDRRTALIPAFTTYGGRTTLLSQTAKFCSNEWKTRVVERYYRSLGLTRGRVLIGFSIDEFQRMRSYDPEAKWNHAYPLIDLRMNRGDCVALVTLRMGWPAPPRSSCWCCPYRTDREWLHLKRTDPQDFIAAIHLDRELRAVDPSLFLHRSGVPLDSAELGEAQTDMFVGECNSGMCFT